MPTQDNFGRLGFFEDFHGYAASSTLSDGTAYRYNDITLAPMSGDVTFLNIVDETGGVTSMAFTAASRPRTFFSIACMI